MNQEFQLNNYEGEKSGKMNIAIFIGFILILGGLIYYFVSVIKKKDFVIKKKEKEISILKKSRIKMKKYLKYKLMKTRQK